MPKQENRRYFTDRLRTLLNDETFPYAEWVNNTTIVFNNTPDMVKDEKFLQSFHVKRWVYFQRQLHNYGFVRLDDSKQRSTPRVYRNPKFNRYVIELQDDILPLFTAREMRNKRRKIEREETDSDDKPLVALLSKRRKVLPREPEPLPVMEEADTACAMVIDEPPVPVFSKSFSCSDMLAGFTPFDVVQYASRYITLSTRTIEILVEQEISGEFIIESVNNGEFLALLERINIPEGHAYMLNALAEDILFDSELS